MNDAVDNLGDLKSSNGTFMIDVLINIFSKSSCFVQRVITNQSSSPLTCLGLQCFMNEVTSSVLYLDQILISKSRRRLNALQSEILCALSSQAQKKMRKVMSHGQIVGPCLILQNILKFFFKLTALSIYLEYSAAISLAAVQCHAHASSAVGRI